jgi:hypothetical protein
MAHARVRILTTIEFGLKLSAQGFAGALQKINN